MKPWLIVALIVAFLLWTKRGGSTAPLAVSPGPELTPKAPTPFAGPGPVPVPGTPAPRAQQAPILRAPTYAILR